jgi:hypothetical protein
MTIKEQVLETIEHFNKAIRCCTLFRCHQQNAKAEVAV